MDFLKVNSFLQLTTSSGNKLQSQMAAGKKCLKVFVVQIGSLSDIELLSRVSCIKM